MLLREVPLDGEIWSRRGSMKGVKEEEDLCLDMEFPSDWDWEIGNIYKSDVPLSARSTNAGPINVSWGNCWLFQSTTKMFVLICDMRVAVTLKKQQHRQFWVTAVSPGPFKTAFSSTIFKHTTFYDTGQGNTWLAIHCYYKSIQNHDVQLVVMKSLRTEMSEMKNRKEKNTSCCQELDEKAAKRESGGFIVKP